LEFLITLAALTVAQLEFNSKSNYFPTCNLIIHIITQPCIFGLRTDSRSTVTAKKLMDGGTNICITGDLLSLVGVTDIPPMAITVAILGNTTVSLDDYCTKRSYTPLSLEDGSIYWQLCYFCANAVETIIPPQAVLATSDVFTSWMQTGYKDNRPGLICFDSSNGFLSMYLRLECHDGLYYCVLDVYTMDKDLQPTPPAPMSPKAAPIVTMKPPSSLRRPSCYTPTSKGKQLQLELWLL
jgi:hypothetical protein